MVDQAVQRNISGTTSVTSIGFGRNRLAALAVVVVAAVAVAVALVPASSETRSTTASVSAETARWDALVAAEYPAATTRVRAEADRLTAFAAAYESGTVLTPGRLAEMARWEALADQALRARTTETARWTGLAAHHLAQTSGIQAWADRYQGLADASD
jgi:hypothetical protein